MANIIITKRCNLNCPYCFAQNYMNSSNNIDITLEQIENILNFLARTPDKISHISLLGGEPLLHPQFYDLYTYINEFLQEHNMVYPPAIITNGIQLLEYENFFNNAIIKININSPEFLGEQNWNQLKQGIIALKNNNQIEIGINLYYDMEDFDYIFELANELNLNNIKCSYVAPTGEQKNIKNRFDYYNNGKELFINFCASAIANNITIGMDCNSIPKCLFSEEEMNIVQQAGARSINWCYPALDIMPDMKISSCFGFSNPVNLLDFNNLEEIENYFINNFTIPKIELRTDCANNCPLNLYSIQQDLEKCQGGCLGFNT